MNIGLYENWGTSIRLSEHGKLGLKTSYGKELPVMKVMSGTADIVTKGRSLLQRILKIKR